MASAARAAPALLAAAAGCAALLAGRGGGPAWRGRLPHGLVAAAGPRAPQWGRAGGAARRNGHPAASLAEARQATIIADHAASKAPSKCLNFFSREVLQVLADSTEVYSLKEFQGLPWTELLEAGAAGISNGIAKGWSMMDPPLPSLLARCSLQFAKAGAGPLACTPRLLAAVLGEALEAREAEGVRVLTDAAEAYVVAGLAPPGQLRERLGSALLERLEVELHRPESAGASAGRWSDVLLRVERLRTGGVLPQAAADEAAEVLEEAVAERLPEGRIGSLPGAWRRLVAAARARGGSRAGLARPAAAVGKALRRRLEAAAEQGPGAARPRLDLDELARVLDALAERGWWCPEAERPGAALEGRFAEAVRGEIAQLRTARLALLVEACGATGFPSSGEGPLRAALSAAFASRTLSLQEAADSGLRLALAGVSDAAVYDAMAAAATAAAEEGQRWQPRWLVGAVARLALCGIVVPALCVSCAAALGQGGQDEGRESRAVKEMAAGSFSFFSELPLVYLHLKGTHVHKMAHAPSGACEVPASAGAWAGPGGFADPCRPLVVDLGCGRGAWLLQMLAEDGPAARAGWNGLGVDTMPRLLAYPRGLSCRWGQHGRLRFALGGAEEALRRLASYPGPVVLVGLHFPTPYAAEGGSPERRNAQLPALEDFIVGSGMEEALCRLGGSSSLPRTPLVFVQSATEEVAVTVRRLLEKGGGLEAVAGAALAAHAAVRPLAPAADPTAAAAAPTAPPAGCGRRGSAGPEEEHGGWLPSSPFSPTETEALLAASGRSVWRLALAPRAEACRSGASEGF